MTTIRELIKRDLGVKIEGVVKVFDRSSLTSEVREYVVTDKIEEELKKILDTVTHVSGMIRRRGPSRDVMGVWISGFFGSGKSHFAKVLGHLLQNTPLDDGTGQGCIDVFVNHLSDTPRGRDIRLRLGELKLSTRISTIFFEIKSRQPYGRLESVGEILLSEFYRFLGYSENLHVAAVERYLDRLGLLPHMEAEFETQFGVPWRSREGRDDLATFRGRLAEILPKVAPDRFSGKEAAYQGIRDISDLRWLTPEHIAQELVDWVDAQASKGGEVVHLVFVIDEMGTFIGDSHERISELNSLAEMIGSKGKGKVWLVVTSQQDLERVVDRTNFQPALVGRLNARFDLKPHLISDEITKVVSERILKKHPSKEGVLRELYKKYEGPIAQLADLKASRQLSAVTEKTFVDAYPFLPHQIQLAQEIFEALSGFRISGGVRSMISVVMEALQEVVDDPIGVIVGFDQIFDAVKNDLLSQEYLGASGVEAIQASDERVPHTPLKASRVLKVLWLLQRVTWVPRIPETLAKLLARELDVDIPRLRAEVEETLGALREAGYVARDEASGEWKFLNERERTIEQTIQELMRPGGPRSTALAMLRRRGQEMCRQDVLTRKRLANFTVLYGQTRVPFGYNVFVDEEAVETGAELEVRFITPFAPARATLLEEIKEKNLAAGANGRTVWWVSATPEALEARLRRYEALIKVTADKRFVDDTSRDTQDALAEKRKERDELQAAIARDFAQAFLSGTLYYGGQEVALEGGDDLKEPLERALVSLIPNVFTRFAMADKPFEFAKDLKALLNPATTKLSEVAPELALFDTQGALQRDSALVGQVLEVLGDLEDEGIDPTGAVLIQGKEGHGFRGFSKPPFGWPDELVRLVLAAGLRAGAVYLERHTAGGTVPSYDFSSAEEIFSKVNTFKKTTFRLSESTLSVDQIKAASRALLALGEEVAAESGNAIAAAVRKLGEELRAGIAEATRWDQEGLPVAAQVLQGEQILQTALTATDPTQCVKAFLEAVDQWKALREELAAFRMFLNAGRQQDFQLSRRFEALARIHPIPNSDPRHGKLEVALRDMLALVADRAVIARWADYRDAFDRAFATYREVYTEAYDRARGAATEAVNAIRGGSAYGAAPADLRDEIVDRVFGAGGVCAFPPIALDSVNALLEAAARRSLTDLTQALVAIPAYQVRVEEDLRKLVQQPPPPDQPVYQWHASTLRGRRFCQEAEVDAALQEVADELKERIRQGFVVEVH